eukprot:CAMPEP_0185759014 /NCGR_PEP_ID=MMETSP1174-20130828/17709_1 /TAXON_ID=35687 /ORGANISM="Dictyocha speculum, Strain CCMP1381" /LENGTH=194 /DNA_ID=CAMNT_0028439137 /DNA_START=221 /DNA_END=805 /DNA_ORIENTATION=-
MTVLSPKDVEKNLGGLWPAEIHNSAHYAPNTPHKTTGCSYGSSVLEFDQMRICWNYVFNLKSMHSKWKAAPDKQKTPWNNCGDWAVTDVDVILSLLPAADIKKWWFPLAGLGPGKHGIGRPKVLYVGNSFGDLVQPRLRHAYCCNPQLPQPDQKGFKAQPTSCEKSDVHMAQPGIPDYAAELWLMMLASGAVGV